MFLFGTHVVIKQSKERDEENQKMTPTKNELIYSDPNQANNNISDITPNRETAETRKLRIRIY